MDDVAALRPTLFIAVPRILERVEDGGGMCRAEGVRVCADVLTPSQSRRVPQLTTSVGCGVCAGPAVAGMFTLHSFLPPSFLPSPVRGKLRKAGAVSRALFNAAFAYKLSLLKLGLPFG